MTWDEWATRHATLFGLGSEADLAMLREFATLFAEGGWMPSQMHQASRDMAIASPPRFRSEHLAGLLAAVRARSAREAARGPSEGEIGPPGASCALCDGSGILADMPNPDTLGRANGVWTTCAVSCDCGVGVWLRRRQGARALISLRDYETLVPAWRELQAARVREFLAWASARKTATQLDRVMGQLMTKVRHLRGEQCHDNA